MSRVIMLCLLWAICCGRTAAAEDPFAAQVRTTPPLAPADQQASFRLPNGFHIQLFASEPEIHKPLNMAFDARGRLWVTNTVEYPHAAPADRPGRDSIRILEDTDGDGRADTVTTFADGLNIPIGLAPYQDGAIVFSIPHIWHLRDTDGDGRADERRKLYGPFGFDRDTHGLNNAFRRVFDGWVYACHGFNNQTTVAGIDGHQVTMQSGNTYRFRVDGSRIEHFTWGQVNPFGMAADALGNLFTADCHSKPVYQLVRGGYYPSFGKPHDGLGFVPAAMQHTHGSTAIAGIAIYEAEQFPAEYRGNIFTGNVMTSRVNRDRREFAGSTVKVIEEPDFVSTTDPWFRPVDLQVGPDGALYVADFYNRIIGHYEVPLNHPGRDRHRGRIWRISYGNAGQQPAAGFDVRKMSTSALPAVLDDANATRRILALNELADRGDAATADTVQAAFRKSRSSRLRRHALWALHRLNALPDEILSDAAGDEHAAVRTHAMRILSELPSWNADQRKFALKGLEDSDPTVCRCAAEALGRHPESAHVPRLLVALKKAPAEDVLLQHTIRIAVRNHLRQAGTFAAVDANRLSADDSRALAGIAVAVPSAEAGSFLIHHLQSHSPAHAADADAGLWLQHAARYAPPAETDILATLIRKTGAIEIDLQCELLQRILDGFERRGLPPSETLHQWAGELTGAVLTSTSIDRQQWNYRPLEGQPPGENPWGVRVRTAQDGKPIKMLDSIAYGERLTGVLRSQNFVLPKTLRMYVAGHNGLPNQPAVKRNVIHLREAATGRVLRECFPPRNDVAQLVEWNLVDVAGQTGYLELTDGHTGSGYAWLAIGRIEPSVVELPEMDPRTAARRAVSAVTLIERLRLSSFEPQLRELLVSDSVDTTVRAAAARAHSVLRPGGVASALSSLMAEPGLSESHRQHIGRCIAGRDDDQNAAIVMEIMKSSPAAVQLLLAQALVGDPATAEQLIQLIAAGRASPRLLQNETVRLRLQSLGSARIDKQVAKLTEKLPPVNAAVQQAIQSQQTSFHAGTFSAERGREVFQKHCSLCHQLGAEGKLIGPQLDGIGNRGLERILEDILDPNRNVDVAFRATTFILSNGSVRTGLVRSDEGAVLVMVDNRGQEFTIRKADIEEQIRSNVSLMPEGILSSVSPEDLNHLLAFLLEQRGRRDSQ